MPRPVDPTVDVPVLGAVPMVPDAGAVLVTPTASLPPVVTAELDSALVGMTAAAKEAPLRR